MKWQRVERRWIYYDVKKTALHDTPYIGEKIGDKKYEMVTVSVRGGYCQDLYLSLINRGGIRRRWIRQVSLLASDFAKARSQDGG